MYLTRHLTADGSRWAVDRYLLPSHVSLARLLQYHSAELSAALSAIDESGERAGADLQPPLEPLHEVWAAGVTYVRSREAREAESMSKDLYARVYGAERPEIFFKAIGWRARGHGMPIRVRADSRWNVPEPELTLVVNAHREIVGYCAGNDVSSRDIEGENPLYLPQAKIYDGACALGPGIVLADAAACADLAVTLEVSRGGRVQFEGGTQTSRIVRRLDDLVECLTRETAFPEGVFLMTGTGIVPPDDFSLQPGDVVRITVGELTLENDVA